MPATIRSRIFRRVRARILGLVWLAACHHGHARSPGDFEGHPDERFEGDGDVDESDPPAPRHELPPAVLDPEPALAVATIAPGAAGDKPWPLTELPSTQPHLDVAMARDACTAGLARPQHADVHAYLAAWCRLRGGDPQAVAALAPLAVSARADVMRAARLDVIDLIANANEPRIAIARLAEYGLATPENEQILAATYVALKAPASAGVVADALVSIDPKPSPRLACERLLAWGVIDAGLAPRLAALDERSGDDRCAPRALALQCALGAAMTHRRGDLGARLVAMRECFRALPDDPDRDAKLELILVHARWPARDGASWLELERHAEVALGLPGGEALAVAALDNALLDSDCEPDTLDGVHAAVQRIAALPAHALAFDAQLTQLAQVTAPTCIALHPAPRLR